MKKNFPKLALLCLLTAIATSTTTLAQSDRCHVYVLDVKSIQEFREKTDLESIMKKPKQEQEALVKAAGLEQYEEFTPTLREEEMTTKTFLFRKGRRVITASVYYTDESMPSENNGNSMVLAISVAAKASDDAISATGAAVAEISYDEHTDTVRVKKNTMIDGRLYTVGLQCRHQQKEPNKKN